MTTLPATTEKKLGLAIDLDTCVGCHACVISCKEWNTSNYGAPLADTNAYGADPVGSFLNRVHTF
ncbi:MAG: (Fe-S)-binding protein, partial [Pseudomonadota bacterium]|nr:(Fe-S)-binding protein [Pseudomonadota bacterium]